MIANSVEALLLRRWSRTLALSAGAGAASLQWSFAEAASEPIPTPLEPLDRVETIVGESEDIPSAEDKSQLLLDLDWDRPIEELAADEACPPCFKSELLGPCGKSFAPAYKCFRLCQLEDKDTDICFDLFAAYMDCVKLNPERYGQSVEEMKKEEHKLQQQQQHQQVDEVVSSVVPAETSVSIIASSSEEDPLSAPFTDL